MAGMTRRTGTADGQKTVRAENTKYTTGENTVDIADRINIEDIDHAQNHQQIDNRIKLTDIITTTNMEEPIEERFIAKRVIKLVYLVLVTFLSGMLLGLLHRLHFGNILAIGLLDVLFSVLFISFLESDRLHRKDKPDTTEDYQRVCIYYTAGILVMLGASFLPAYTAPVIAVSFLLASGLNREQALVIALFFNTQMALAGNMTVYVLTCYSMMTLLGVILTSMYEQKENRKYAEMIMLAVSVAIPVLFYYLEHGIPTWMLLLIAFLSGAVGMLGMHFLYDGLHTRLIWSDEISLDTIVDPSYHLVKEIKKYSQADYNHAIRVSRIAAHCAATVKADVKRSAVAGFYYRLGTFGGEPVVENGVKIAQNNCFPHTIITILSEYNGIQNPISSIESAIVHITDTVVTKFELLDRTTLSSTWNRDMVIYQTLNDNSSSGIYDSSGLTMNQFLKIREYLAKEEELL